MAPIPTLLLTQAFITFFIALRITTRDREDTFFRDFGLVALYSLISAASVRIATAMI